MYFDYANEIKHMEVHGKKLKIVDGTVKSEC